MRKRKSRDLMSSKLPLTMTCNCTGIFLSLNFKREGNLAGLQFRKHDVQAALVAREFQFSVCSQQVDAADLTRPI